jgi:hypothetical protein
MKTTYSCDVWTVGENAKLCNLYGGLSVYKRENGKLPHGMQARVMAATLARINAASPVVRKSLDRKMQNVSQILKLMGRADLICPGFKPLANTQIDEKARGEDPMLWSQVAAMVLDMDAGIVAAVAVQA